MNGAGDARVMGGVLVSVLMIVQSWSRIGGVRGIDPCPPNLATFSLDPSERAIREAAYDDTFNGCVSLSYLDLHSTFALRRFFCHTNTWHQLLLPFFPPPSSSPSGCAHVAASLRHPLNAPWCSHSSTRSSDHTTTLSQGGGPLCEVREEPARAAAAAARGFEHHGRFTALYALHCLCYLRMCTPAGSLNQASLTVNCTGTSSLLLHQLIVRLVGQLASVPGHNHRPNHTQCCPHPRNSSTPTHDPQ